MYVCAEENVLRATSVIMRVQAFALLSCPVNCQNYLQLLSLSCDIEGNTGHQNTRSADNHPLQWDQLCQLIKSCCGIISGIMSIEGLSSARQQTTRWLLRIAIAKLCLEKNIANKVRGTMEGFTILSKMLSQKLMKICTSGKAFLVPGCADMAWYNVQQQYLHCNENSKSRLAPLTPMMPNGIQGA